MAEKHSTDPAHMPKTDCIVDDPLELLDEKLTHLGALLNVSYGCGGKAFRQYSACIQDNYLWACAKMAGECRELLQLSRKGGAA